VHFNHGLHPDAEAWQQHCVRFCESLNIPIDTVQLALKPDEGDLENRARALRYGHIGRVIDGQTIYLTAHHADDRSETLLLNALRGSGLEGLSSIPRIRKLGAGWVARPLLDFDHEELRSYLRSKKLDWIEDPSNRDLHMDRNFIRHQILPLLETRWPAVRTTLARTAEHVGHAAETLSRLLRRETEMDRYTEAGLPLSLLDRYKGLEKSLILREWVRGHHAPAIPHARLETLLQQLGSSSPAAGVEIEWTGWSIRRFKTELRLLPPGRLLACPQRDWNPVAALPLGNGVGIVRLEGKQRPEGERWAIGPRRAGGKIRMHSGGPRRKIKKVLQDQAIPPWQRQSIPVLYWGEKAVAVGDWLCAPEFSQWLSDRDLVYRWLPDDPSLRDTRAKCRADANAGSPLDHRPGLG
jgi:tRNA(Ile)-lysidine synthase